LTSPAGITGTVGEEGGAGAQKFPCVALDPEVCRDPRWCAKCGGLQVFVAVYECEAGRVGFCLGCGEEKLVRFSRAVSEVA